MSLDKQLRDRVSGAPDYSGAGPPLERRAALSRFGGSGIIETCPNERVKMNKVVEFIGVSVGTVGMVLLALVAVFYPLIRIGVCIYIVFLGMKTMYYWDTPGVYPGWTLMAWFAGLVIFECSIAKINEKIQAL